MNKTKSKIMKLGKNGEENGVNIRLNNRKMKKLKYTDISE